MLVLGSPMPEDFFGIHKIFTRHIKKFIDFYYTPQVNKCTQMSSRLTKRALEPYVSRSASVLKGRLIPLVGRCLILGSICGCAFGRPTVAGWSRGRIHGELRAGPRRSSHA